MADAEDAGGFQRTLKDLFAGAVGGVMQVLIGMSCCHKSVSFCSLGIIAAVFIAFAICVVAFQHTSSLSRPRYTLEFAERLHNRQRFHL